MTFQSPPPAKWYKLSKWFSFFLASNILHTCLMDDVNLYSDVFLCIMQTYYRMYHESPYQSFTHTYMHGHSYLLGSYLLGSFTLTSSLTYIYLHTYTHTQIEEGMVIRIFLLHPPCITLTQSFLVFLCGRVLLFYVQHTQYICICMLKSFFKRHTCTNKICI